MDKIYITGKVTGTDYQKCKEKFKLYEEMLKSDGYKVINPTKYVPEEATWDEAIAICLSLLKTCDIIFLISDWKDSKGSGKVLIYALENNYKIMTYYDITVG